jgi:hypothetical protein
MEEEFDYNAFGLTPVTVGGNTDEEDETEIAIPTTVEPSISDAGGSDPYYEGLSEEQRVEFDGMSTEIQDMYRGNPGMTVVTTPTESNLDPLPGGLLAVNFTDEVKATQKPSDFTFEGIYGDVRDPETGEVVERPGMDFRLRGLAALFDVINGGETNPVQQARDDRTEQIQRFDDLASSVFEDLPGVEDEDGNKVYQEVIRDENGDVVMGEDGLPQTNAIALPDPSSRAWMRMTTNVVNGLFEQIGGYVSEGAVLEESDVERSVPNYEQDGFEEFITNLTLFGIPAVGASKLVKSTASIARSIPALNYVGQATRLRAAAMYGTTATAVSLSEAIMSTEGDEGFFISPEVLQKYLGVEDEQSASDWAMFLDGMVFSGAIDSLGFVAGFAKRFADRRVTGVRAAVDEAYLRNRAYQETILSLVTTLDPAIREVSPGEGRRRMTKMAEMLSANSVMEVTLGEVTAEIPRNSVISVLNGAKGYIAETRQSLKNTMTDEEWLTYVDNEAANMALSMLTVTRAMGSDTAIIQSNNDMAAEIANVIRSAGAQDLPAGVDGPEFFLENFNKLLDDRVARITSAKRDVDLSSALKTSAEESASNAAQDNPVIADILSAYPEGQGFNRGDLANAAADVMAGPLREEFNNTWRNVRELYENIPNNPIGEDAAAALKGQIESVILNINTLDNSGDRTKNTLGRIYTAIRPQQVPDPAGDLVIETAEELMQRLGNLGFQDLYRAKRNISRMIDAETNPEIRANLENLSSHITSSGTGGQMSFLIENGDEATVTAARDADEAFITARNMFEDTRPMQRYSELAREARRGDSTLVPEGSTPRGIRELRASSLNEILPSIVGDVTGAYMENFMYAIRNLSPEQATPFVKYYEAQAKFELAAALRAGDNNSVNRIFDVASTYRTQLEAVGSNLSDTLYEVGANVRRRETELGGVTAAADMSMDAAQTELKAAQDNILSRFINPATDDIVGNPDSVIRDIMFDKQGGDRMRELLAEADRLPDAERALAVTALRERVSDILVTELTGSTPVSLRGDSAQYATMMGRLNGVLNGSNTDTMGVVQALYKDDPEYFQSLTTVLGGLMESNISARLRTATAGSDTAINEQLRRDVQDSVGTGLLLLFGYMNPRAAAARKLTAQQLANVDNLAKTVGKDTLLVAVTNPMEFANMIRQLRTTKDPKLRTQILNHFGQIFSHGLGYDIRVSGEGEAPLLDQAIDGINAVEQEMNSVLE